MQATPNARQDIFLPGERLSRISIAQYYIVQILEVQNHTHFCCAAYFCMLVALNGLAGISGQKSELRTTNAPHLRISYLFSCLQSAYECCFKYFNLGNKM